MNDSIKIWQSVVEEPDTSLLTSTVVHHAGILLKAVYQLVFREYKHGENYCNDHKTDRTTTASGAARVEHSEFPPDALEHSKIHCSANSKAPEKECQPNLESGKLSRIPWLPNGMRGDRRRRTSGSPP